MWPGDLLNVAASSASLVAPLLVRAVKIQMAPTAPEMLHYTIGYANEWAEEFSVRSTVGAPASVWLPVVALTAPTALPSAAGLTVASISTSQIQVAAGLTAPSGGGFEVRRSDGGFGPSSGGDLVLRSPAANFTIVREAPVEHYYVRLYDGANPPNYSRYSSAIFVNAAMQ